VIGIEEIDAAAARLAGHTAITPLLSAPGLEELCGRPVVCKAENLQRTGSFKLRSALNHVLALPAQARAGGLVAASSGNHAQALALAARLVDSHAVVVVPADAPPVKVETARGLGAEVVVYDRGRDDRGGHLMLVTGLCDGVVEFHNPSGHTERARRAALPAAVFEAFFAGRGIALPMN
jgi:threonine dehydratase